MRIQLPLVLWLLATLVPQQPPPAPPATPVPGHAPADPMGRAGHAGPRASGVPAAAARPPDVEIEVNGVMPYDRAVVKLSPESIEPGPAR